MEGYENLGGSLDEWRRMERWAKEKGRPTARLSSPKSGAPLRFLPEILCELCGLCERNGRYSAHRGGHSMTMFPFLS